LHQSKFQYLWQKIDRIITCDKLSPHLSFSFFKMSGLEIEPPRLGEGGGHFHEVAALTLQNHMTKYFRKATTTTKKEFNGC